MLQNLFTFPRHAIQDLSEAEILALAISSEEDDARIYAAYGDAICDQFPQSAKVFYEMAEEENAHRARLIKRYQARFGKTIPLIRREHVRGFYKRKPTWLMSNISIDAAREEAEAMEEQACRFYNEAVKLVADAGSRDLLAQLAMEERGHMNLAQRLSDHYTPQDIRKVENKTQRKQLVLTYIQPGLAGLMDGSISTLAPIFATAFATYDTWTTFLVGTAASVGAGISMGFTEVASDDGVISGRGSPVKRGVSCGLMTMVGGMGHALPYLIPDFWTATTLAIVLVFLELWVIAWIQRRFMETSWSRAVLQVVLGGALVFAAGIFIGLG